MTKDTELEDKYKHPMYVFAKSFEQFIKETWPELDSGFLVAMFDIGDKGRFNYASNCNRDDIIVLLKEMLARFEGMPESPPGRA